MSASTKIPAALDCTAIADVAASWVVRRREGLSAREEQEFSDWLKADSAHRAAFEESLRGWEVAGSAGADPRLLKMRTDALMSRPRRLSRMPLAASIAALLLVSGTSAFLVHPWTGTGQSEAPAARASRIYQTAVGERSTVTLEDGSQVTLNTSSRLKVSYSPKERDLVLLAGQALFQVAHDSRRPFVVSALDRQVIATGTEFEVRVDRGSLRVALLEGHVVVKSDSRAAAMSSPPAPARLAPGEQLVAKEGRPAEIAGVDVDRLTSWREGRVRFADTPLSEAVAEMNRYSNIPIVIEDARAGEIRISGAFVTGRSQDFASAVATLFPVRASEANGQIRLRSAG